jgi:hypothetical protein
MSNLQLSIQFVKINKFLNANKYCEIMKFAESPARGCAGPQGMSAADRAAMLLGREKCPNGNTLQIVHRWYRRVFIELNICTFPSFYRLTR